MQEAKRFEAWQAAARELNTLNGLSQASLNARWSRETRLYDRKLLAQRLEHLRAVRSQGNIQRMLFAMRQDLLRNLGNMTNRCGMHGSELFTSGAGAVHRAFPAGALVIDHFCCWCSPQAASVVEEVPGAA